jgi:hypothetical protein
MQGIGAALLVVLIWIFAFALALLIAAWLLRAACYVLRVHRPSYPRAIQVVLAAWLANLLAGLALGFTFVIIATTAGQVDPERLELLANVMGFTIGALVSAWVYMTMIPTRYGKALAIYFVQMLIMFLVALSVSFIFSLFVGAVQAAVT